MAIGAVGLATKFRILITPWIQWTGCQRSQDQFVIGRL